MHRAKLIPLLLLFCSHAWATGYFLSPTGSDGNSGLSASAAWLSPNHAVNCGDTLTAAAGSYAAANFYTGKWGTVTCPTNNNVAWIVCATFDACKVSSAATDAVWIDKPYWGMQGWEATTSTSTNGACFHIGPNGSSGIVHHVIMANDIANGCMGSGFTAYGLNANGANVDYIAYLGNIAYNSDQGTAQCYSGFNIGYPGNYDTAGGTHMYVAGNFSWANVDGNPCPTGSTGTTDGEGINFDTWDLSQLSGVAYTGQGAIENNIAFLNGGYGIEVENNAAGSTHAPIFIWHNTTYGNRRDTHGAYCTGNGDLYLYNASNVSYEYNLTYSGYATDCASAAYYAFAIGSGNGTDTYDYNYASGVSGNNTFINASSGFSLGTHNTIGTNPGFANAVNPGAPSCGSFSGVPACMATVVADYVATVAAAQAYGYQSPQTSGTDSLFPQWLCSANIPSGLVAPSCVVAVSIGGTVSVGGSAVAQ